MNSDLHIRAQKLIAQQRVEGITREEEFRLAAHLAECESCAAFAREMEQALSAFRGVTAEVPRGLVNRTQLRVRLRAEELRERAPGRALMWAIAAVSWALGVATAPWVWRGFEWIGDQAGLSKPVWELGVVLWWAVPALIATGAVIFERRGRTQELE